MQRQIKGVSAVVANQAKLNLQTQQGVKNSFWTPSERWYYHSLDLTTKKVWTKAKLMWQSLVSKDAFVFHRENRVLNLPKIHTIFPASWKARRSCWIPWDWLRHLRCGWEACVSRLSAGLITTATAVLCHTGAAHSNNEQTQSGLVYLFLRNKEYMNLIY